MKMLTVAGGLDWGGWLRGVIGSIISGGAAAAGGSLGTIVVDPMHFNLNGGLADVLKVAGVAFTISALVSLAKFLQTNPIPTDAPPPAAKGA